MPSDTPDKVTLYELAEAYRAAMKMTDETGGEITDEIQKAFDAIEGPLAAKFDAYASLIREAEATAKVDKARADCYRDEVEFYGDRAKASQRKADSLKARLLDTLVALGKTEGKGDVFKIKVMEATTPTIRFLGDPRDIPEAYRRTKIELDADKVKATIMAYGSVPEGFSAVKSKYIKIS
jgi:hypothetical protein